MEGINTQHYSFEDSEARAQIMEEIMKDFGDDILRLAFSYVRDHGTAEDIAQEVFLRCYTKIDQFRQESNLKTWLYKITVNRCKDHLRSAYFKKTFLTDVINKIRYKKTESTESISIEKQDSERVVQEILSLPTKFCEVLYLYYYEELTLQEISDLINVNLNTLKSRLTRGRQLLKHKLEGGDFHE
ncbi:sigma-70 family RNA polymerase sigma factor [Pseudalkalibacillus caeni]|uniref:Sigma-70 family RNA polymerase sigma factor n=1 Tax=Exobacillus caeni TaxID=2574798 RepID=A0A5R9F0B9_9BACL|nr:sigma-70 family RNA polymerase sigma factor [Pseudalkalibacillus caeni]TLS36967.1 sigma-70 family RNA polymerase sigma factor [Pseudalkalibacillus caeni]